MRRTRRVSEIRADLRISEVAHRALLTWYDQHRRDLPWRRTSDPYAIWVSEAMLQQTQVATVIPYWERWMTTFPTVEALADADEQSILAAWQGLGYYRRARLLQQGAKYVAAHGFPNSAEAWEDVPGVGRYTAGAIASIAGRIAAPLVDGNVERVVSRLTGDRSSGPALTRAAWDWAAANLDHEQPGEWNQALMELGATVCRPAQPECPRCPLADACKACASGLADSLPIRPPKRTPVGLQQLVWVPHFDGRFGIRQIPAGEWWEGMWEFPRADLSAPSALAELLGEGSHTRVGTLRHTVTKHRIELTIVLVEVASPSSALRWELPEDLIQVPMPAPQRKVLNRVLRTLDPTSGTTDSLFSP